ncbi:MAG: hypothetical protein ACRD5J_13075, partial [Nitrososphaeraceae archaeon]
LFESAAGRLSTTIEKILTNSSTFERIARDSFLHVNGVYKIVLAKATYQDPEVRLHIWENGINLPGGSNYEHIHNHNPCCINLNLWITTSQRRLLFGRRIPPITHPSTCVAVNHYIPQPERV